MSLAGLQYHRPASLDEAIGRARELAGQGLAFAWLAGGSDLVPRIKQHDDEVQALIALGSIAALHDIHAHGEHGLSIGALASLADVAGDALVAGRAPALAAAAARVASPQIRNQATLGGNLLVDRRCIYYNQSTINRQCHRPCFKAGGDHCPLIKSVRRGDRPQCHARFVSDTVPVLLVMGATVRLAGPGGTRRLPLAELYRPDGIDGLAVARDEVLTAIEIAPPADMRFAYDKLAIRNTLDFPSLGVAAGFDGRRLRVGLTGVNTHPGLLEFAADDFPAAGQMLEAACQQASDFAETYNQDFFGRGYRKDMIPVFLRRLAASLGLAG